MKKLFTPFEGGPTMAEEGATSARLLLCERRAFDFSKVAGTESLVAVIAPALPCAEFASGTLIVRVHDVEIGAEAQLEIRATHASRCPDDPVTDFLLPTPAARVVLGTGDGVGLHIEHLEGLLGTHLQVTVTGAQPRDPVAISATLTIELVVRNVATAGSTTLPAGTTKDAILHYAPESSAWVENAAVTATVHGDVGMRDLAVGGSAAVEGSLLVKDGVGIDSGGLSVGGGGNVAGGLSVDGGLAVDSGNLSVTSNATVGANATIEGNLTVEGQITSPGDLSVNPSDDLLVSARAAKLSVSDNTADGGVHVQSGSDPGAHLRVFTFGGTVNVGASTTSNRVFVNGANDITPQYSGAFVTVQMVARWGTGTVTRAAIRIHRYYSRTTGNAFFTNLLVDALTNSGSIVLSSLSTSNQVGVVITNNGGSAEWVDYAATVTLQSTPVLPT